MKTIGLIVFCVVALVALTIQWFRLKETVSAYPRSRKSTGEQSPNPDSSDSYYPIMGPGLYRAMRIAWSLWWYMLCVLLMVLWVRSYQRVDFVTLDAPGPIIAQISSINGLVGASIDAISPGYWDWVSARPDFFDPTRGLSGQFALLDQNDSTTVIVPHWFLIVLSATLAAVPWIRWKSCLRTLLIATTLVAVLLGLVVWGMNY